MSLRQRKRITRLKQSSNYTWLIFIPTQVPSKASLHLFKDQPHLSTVVVSGPTQKAKGSNSSFLQQAFSDGSTSWLLATYLGILVPNENPQHR